MCSVVSLSLFLLKAPTRVDDTAGMRQTTTGYSTVVEGGLMTHSAPNNGASPDDIAAPEEKGRQRNTQRTNKKKIG